MPIHIESTTDSAEDVMSALGEQKAPAGGDTNVDDQQKAVPENPNVDTDEDDSGESSDDSAASEEEQHRKRKGGFQKRIDKLTRRATELEQQNAALMEALRQSGRAPEQPKVPEKTEPSNNGKPNPDDFESHEDYVEALTDWKVEQKLTANQKKIQEQNAREQQTRQQSEFHSRMDKARERYKDFDEVMGDSEAPVSAAMQEVIIASEYGPDIAYYLANHPDEAEKIANMSALAAAKALGKLEDRIESKVKESGTDGVQKSKTEPQVTKAPRPISPVNSDNSSAGSTTKDPEKMTYQEYKKWRESGGGRG